MSFRDVIFNGQFLWLPSQFFAHRFNHFFALRVTAQLEFREDRFAIHADFKGAARAGDEGEGSDLRFVVLQQVGRETHGPVGVVSNGTVFDPDVYHSFKLTFGY